MTDKMNKRKMEKEERRHVARSGCSTKLTGAYRQYCGLFEFVSE